MGRSRKRSAALKARRVSGLIQSIKTELFSMDSSSEPQMTIKSKPRGFYESPCDDAIDRYLSDPELIEWLISLKRWSADRTKDLLLMMSAKLKTDKTHDIRLFDTALNQTTIGMNTGTWVLWVFAPESYKPKRLFNNDSLPFTATINDLSPDWKKSVFDPEFNFNADTECLHEVIYLRGEGTCGAMGDTLNQAIECFGGLGALDRDVFNTAKDKESFKNLFNPMIESITFGDEDYGFQINRGSAISYSECAA